MKHRVRAELQHSGNIVVLSPATFLGKSMFDLYKMTVDPFCRYDRVTRRQLCPISRYLDVRSALLGIGFGVDEDRDLSRALSASEDRRRAAAARLDQTLSEVSERMRTMRPGSKGLFPHQIEGARFLAGRTRALLADEPGLGKTAQTLSALSPLARAIVACPAVARGVWRDEVKSLRPDLRAVMLPKKSKVVPEPGPGEILIAGYEELGRRLVIPEVCSRRFVLLGNAAAVRVGFRGPRAIEESCGSFGIISHKPVETFAVFYARACRGEPRMHDIYEAWRCNSEMLIPRCGPIPERVPSCTNLIADEAHYLKNKRSIRSRALRKLEEHAGAGWLLTGTPLPNTPPEIWTILDAAGIANLAFGSWEAFVELFGGVWEEIVTRGGKKRRVVKWPEGELDPAHYQKIFEAARPALAKVMLRRKKIEALDLPPKIYQTVEVEIEDSISSACDSIQQKLLEEYGIDIRTIEDTDQLPVEVLSPLRKALATEKTPFAEELVEEYEASSTPLVVFSAHVHPVQTIGSRKGWAYIDGTVLDRTRQKIVSDFAAGRLLGVAATIKSAGTALTLTRASNELFIDLDWVPANNEQASDRCHRIGQDAECVLIRTLVSAHIMDRRVNEVLARKSKLIAATIG